MYIFPHLRLHPHFSFFCCCYSHLFLFLPPILFFFQRLSFDDENESNDGPNKDDEERRKMMMESKIWMKMMLNCAFCDPVQHLSGVQMTWPLVSSVVGTCNQDVLSYEARVIFWLHQ